MICWPGNTRNWQQSMRMKYFGRSLVPVLEEPDKEQREFVCCEGGRLQGEIYADEFHSLKNIGKSDLYWPRLLAQTDDVAHGKATMLRTRYYKYIARSYETDEFYDLRNDPEERKNCIHDPAFAEQINHHKELLLRWYQQTCDVVPFHYDSRSTVEGIWSRVQRYVPSGWEEEIYDRIVKGADQDAIIRYCSALEQS